MSPAELRLFFEPTWPSKISWQTPRTLLRTSLLAQIRNPYPAIGHVAVEVRCPGEEPLLTGAIDIPGAYALKLLLQKKIGFSILQVGWPAHLETASEVREHLAARKGHPERLSAVCFSVNEGTAKRLLDYFRELAREPELFYGNGPRPRYKEGAGCSAFGVSFLEVAGLMTPELREAWLTKVRIPLALMAGHGREKVALWEIFWRRESKRWASAEEPHMDFQIFNPDKMYEWARDLAGERFEEDGISFVRVDRREVNTPVEPIFYGESRLQRACPITMVRSDREFSANGSFSLFP